LAGGTNRTAKLNRAMGANRLRKHRKAFGKQRSHKKIWQAQAPDMPTEAEDIFLVPSGDGKVVLYRDSETIAQATVCPPIVAAPGHSL